MTQKVPTLTPVRNGLPSNRGHLLCTLRDLELASRTDLVQHTGMQASTVSTLVTGLLQDGVLEEVSSREASPRGGRRQILLALAGGRPAAVGLHIGVHLISSTVIDARSTPLRTAAITRPRDATATELVEIAADQVRQLLAEERPGSGDDGGILGVGVTVPAAVRAETGTVLPNPNLGWHTEVALGRMLSDRLDLPVSVDSSPYGQLLAERSFGSLRGIDDALLVNMATTVRMALLKSGQLHAPSPHFAGDLGHFPTGARTGTCACGAVGCLNAVAGYDAISAEVGAALGRRVDIRRVDKLAAAGDQVALRALRAAGRRIAEALVPFLLIYEPRSVVIACPLASTASTLRTELQKCIERHSARLSGRAPVLADATFTSNMAIGAAWLPIEHSLYT